MRVKRFGSESELNARLRQLTEDVRRLREELRESLRDKRHSFKRALDEYSAAPRLRFPSDEDPAY